MTREPALAASPFQERDDDLLRFCANGSYGRSRVVSLDSAPQCFEGVGHRPVQGPSELACPANRIVLPLIVGRAGWTSDSAEDVSPRILSQSMIRRRRPQLATATLRRVPVIGLSALRRCISDRGHSRDDRYAAYTVSSAGGRNGRRCLAAPGTRWQTHRNDCSTAQPATGSLAPAAVNHLSCDSKRRRMRARRARIDLCPGSCSCQEPRGMVGPGPSAQVSTSAAATASSRSASGRAAGASACADSRCRR